MSTILFDTSFPLPPQIFSAFMILITGGAGFIGSNLTRHWLQQRKEPVVVLDALTYAGHLENLEEVSARQDLHFVHMDICQEDQVLMLLQQYQPRAVLHLAAESHVDHAIRQPDIFIRTNVQGTLALLNASLRYWRTLEAPERERFRFLHVSTDEVYGSLSPDAPAFTEDTPYAPNNPYSASKAASDHLVRAWHRTYGLPTLTSHCSNNHGPYQLPEKLIPVMLCNALAGNPLPVYGDGRHVRDWLYVEDHCRALARILDAGQPGEVYNIGGHGETSNLTLVQTLCAMLDELRPRPDHTSYSRLIRFVADRPGHDERYAIDASKLQRSLGWQPQETLASGLRKTVLWYLQHPHWVERMREKTAMKEPRA